jgi:hypothetical protein
MCIDNQSLVLTIKGRYFRITKFTNIFMSFPQVTRLVHAGTSLSVNPLIGHSHGSGNPVCQDRDDKS